MHHDLHIDPNSATGAPRSGRAPFHSTTRWSAREGQIALPIAAAVLVCAIACAGLLWAFHIGSETVLKWQHEADEFQLQFNKQHMDHERWLVEKIIEQTKHAPPDTPPAQPMQPPPAVPPSTQPSVLAPPTNPQVLTRPTFDPTMAPARHTDEARQPRSVSRQREVLRDHSVKARTHTAYCIPLSQMNRGYAGRAEVDALGCTRIFLEYQPLRRGPIETDDHNETTAQTNDDSEVTEDAPET